MDIDPVNPGYKHILLYPHPGGQLTRASAELKSMYGPVKSAWNLDQAQFTYEVTIPANTTATVTLPHADPATVTINQLPLSANKEYKAEQKGDLTVVQLGSGNYRFTYASEQFVSK
jgi:alpha-L-rhamnosidase